MKLLGDYHAQGLSQSKVSFWFSLVFASIGFLIIAYSVLLFTASGDVTTMQAAIRPMFTLVAGTMVDAVSALFFVQSNRARRIMTDFFDKLRVDRKIDEALRLAREVEDKEARSYVTSVIALQFIDVPANAAACSILSEMLTSNRRKAEANPPQTAPTDVKPLRPAQGGT